MDFVVEHGKDAHAGGLRRGGDAHGVQQVQIGVGADGRGRTHGAGDDHRLGRLDGEMEEVGGFLQGSGAVGDDDAGGVRFVAVNGVDALGQGNPVGRPDGGAAHADHILGDDVEVVANLRNPRQVLLDGQMVADFRVADVVHPVGSDAGDAAAGGDDVDGGVGHGSKPPRQDTAR